MAPVEKSDIERKYFSTCYPGPLPSTGDEKLDALVGALATPEKVNDAGIRKKALAGGPAALLPLVHADTLKLGWQEHDEKVLRKLGTKEKKEYQRLSQRGYAETNTRIQFVRWLLRAVATIQGGRSRMLKSLSEAHGPEAKQLVASVLLESKPSTAELAQVGAAIDLEAWDGKDAAGLRYYISGAAALLAADPSKAYQRLSKIFTRRGVAAEHQMNAVLGAMVQPRDYDPRWPKIVAALLGDKTIKDRTLKYSVLSALLGLPADPVVIEPVLATLPKDPKRVANDYVEPQINVLGRVADARVLPYLVEALKNSWMVWPAAFAGFERAGDPAMVNVIREWLAKNGDKGGERDQRGKQVIARLEKLGPVPAAKPEKVKPPRAKKRATLVFKKGPKPQHPALPSIDEQRKVLLELFAEAGLAKHAEALIRPSVRLHATRVEESTVPGGATKLGGRPDLPADVEWPREQNEPLTFLAQLDLGELAPLLPKGALPSSGLLSFFVGEDPDGAAGYLETARVLHTRKGARLVRRDAPEDYFGRIYQACIVKPVPMLKIPSPSNPNLTKRLKGRASDAYADRVAVEPEDVEFQVLGFRDHGWDAENPASAQLLFQCPSNDQAEMSFGDVETLCFYVGAKDLAKGDFSKVWPYFGD